MPRTTSLETLSAPVRGRHQPVTVSGLRSAFRLAVRARGVGRRSVANGDARTVPRKLIDEHLVSAEPIAGEEIALHIDQTLTQDARAAWSCRSSKRSTWTAHGPT
jgi:hypothetical protein